MSIVAGPQGSGKSTLFPVAKTGVDHFNVDARRRQLAGTNHNIPASVREQSQRELRAFIEDHIRDGRSFAFEATLARDITFDQAAEAQRQGFRVKLQYLCTDDIRENLLRVAARVRNKGHGCSPETLRSTYEASLGNLGRALKELDEVLVWDTTVRNQPARLVLKSRAGKVTYVASHPPGWVRSALRATEYEIQLPGEDEG